MSNNSAEGILRHGLARSGNGILRDALRYLIDMRNCLMINKLWRWQVNQPPPLTAGGMLATTSLQRIWATHDSDRLARLTSQRAGEPLPAGKPSPWNSACSRA